jgi:anhydro-N-acetylmuramic acid kinase
MLRLFRPDTPRSEDGRRWTIGVQASSKCDRISAALVGCLGYGSEMLVEVAGFRTTQTPLETAASFAALAGNSADQPPAIAIAACRSQLADVQSALINQLLTSRGIANGRILAVGVHDPGLWDIRGGEVRGFLGLCDAARLAESTGMNILDAFPARDLALGGQGGPITAVAEWILLRSQLRHRALVDLGRTARLSFLPAASADRAEAKILAFEAGPGMSLADAFATRFSEGEHAFDPSGHWAVQGKCIPQLLELWHKDPYFELPPPRWHPRGVRIERFLSNALQLAVAGGWSVRDLLCTATCFIAENVAESLRRWMPEETPVEEILVAGGGQQNGFLLRELARATKLPLLRLGELHLPEEGFEAACAGVLALLYIDQTPGSQTAISKTATPRLLGRLTPGSPQSWKRLLDACTAAGEHLRPLRSAM